MDEFLQHILDALTQLGVSTCKGIADNIGISNKETIHALLEMESVGLVVQLNGFWTLHAMTGTLIKRVAPARIERRITPRCRKGS